MPARAAPGRPPPLHLYIAYVEKTKKKNVRLGTSED